MRSLLIAATLLFGCLLAVAPAHGKERPSLELSPSHGKPGDRIHYSGSGYAPGSDVLIVIGPDSIILDEQQADREGRISGAFKLPYLSDVPDTSQDAISAYAVETGSGEQSRPTRFHYDAGGSNPTPTASDTGTLTFVLIIGKHPQPDSTYWAVYGQPGSSPSVRRLTDPDGDGKFTLSVQVPSDKPVTARIVQGTGTRTEESGVVPGEPLRVLRDFGNLIVREGLKLSATDRHPSVRPREQRTAIPYSLPETGFGGMSVAGGLSTAALDRDSSRR